MASSMNWAYVAGFFDGEGHVRMNNSGSRNIETMCVGITQKKTKVLGIIMDFLESNGIRCGYSDRGSAASHVIITGRDNISKFLRGVIPFLVVKKPEAQDFLRFFTIYPRGLKSDLNKALRQDVNYLN